MPTPQPHTSETLVLPSGQRATVSNGALVLEDAEGRAVVRYGEAGLEIISTRGDLTLSAPEGRVVIQGKSIDMRGERWLTRFEEAAMVAGRWELRATRVVESATDVYRSCEGALQVRAGRARHLVDRAWDVVAGRASIASEEETKIDGKQVLLG